MIKGHIEWQDETEDTAFEVPTRAYTRHLVESLHAEGLNVREIAERLNAEDILNLQGRPWTMETVASKVSQIKRASNE